MVNDQEIRPVTVSSGQARWPEDLDGRLRSAFPRLELIPALEIARALGNMRVVNVVMIGALAGNMDLEDGLWRQAITAMVKPKFLDLNIKAYESGRSAARGAVLGRSNG